MLVTDRPEAFLVALDLRVDWCPVPSADLPPFDRLVLDALAPGAEVWVAEDGEVFWHRRYLIDEARGSQFDALREILARLPGGGAGLPGPIAALALTGRGFHGQRGRLWAAGRGNLHLCAALAPQLAGPDHALALTTLPAVVAVDAIRRANNRLAPRIKWVNDVLLGGGKVAGVLTATQSAGGTVDAAVFGIGMNVGRTPEVEPTPFVPRATSVRTESGGEDVSLGEVARRALAGLATRVRCLRAEGPAGLIAEYLAAAQWMIGRRIRIYPEDLAATAAEAWPAPLAAGTLVGIRSDLGLLLEGGDEPVQRGRLAFEESCEAFGLPPL